MGLPIRKHPRLEGYDYAQNGCYFITICVKDRKHLFGTIPRNEDPPNVHLTRIGELVQNVIGGVEKAYPYVFVDAAVVMPNHIHLLLRIDCPPAGRCDRRPRPTVMTVVHALKRITAKRVGFSVWQDSFYEHTVRNGEDYQMIWNYIEGNPSKWAEDKYYSL